MSGSSTELEARGLLPDRARRAEIRAEAEHVARRVHRLRRATAQHPRARAVRAAASFAACLIFCAGWVLGAGWTYQQLEHDTDDWTHPPLDAGPTHAIGEFVIDDD